MTVPARLAGLMQAADGNYYGTTTYGGRRNADRTIFKITPAGKLTTLYQFCNLTNSNGYCLDGGAPMSALVQTSNGDFYGTTYNGGTGLDNSGGTIFKLSAAGKLTTLYSFCQRTTTCADGAYPFTGLIQAKNGNLYGVTRYGGYHPWARFSKSPRQENLLRYYFPRHRRCRPIFSARARLRRELLRHDAVGRSV